MPPTSPLRTAQPLRPTSFSPDLILFLRRQLHSISSPTPQLARSSKPTRLRSLFRRKSSSLGGHILRHPTPRRHNGPPQTFFTHYQNNKPSSIRHFTQHPSLLHLISGRPVLRPQLPFLHNPSAHHHQYNNLLNQYLRIKRHLLSTETKARWKRSVRGAVKLHLYFWPGLLFLYLLGFGYHQTWLEHEFPTVREWSFWNRWTLRLARAQEFEKMEFDAEGNGAGGRVEGVERVLVNWKKVGGLYGNLLDGLEDVNGDGRNVLGRGDDGGEIYVDGVGRTGWDVSMKSEPWRRGYWEALMGAGRAAERLEGMVVKKRVGGRGKWHITWGYWNLTEARERETVLGPSNPRPRPLAKGEGEPWNEDEVEDAFPPAEKFYLRILTTKGFSSAQKVDAALAYADWCDYKKLPETAEGIFDWAMDIAIAGAESQGSPTADVVDRKTGVVHTTATDLPSANILKVSTALGVHFAQSGDLKKALPVFLSVLKARRELPPEPVDLGRAATDPSKKDPTEPPSMLQSVLHLLKDWFIEVPYPPAPPSGDAPPFHTLKEACEEVGLMTYMSVRSSTPAVAVPLVPVRVLREKRV